jgi:hypothetical protein
MSIEVACPGCAKAYTLPETQQGKRARCKRCGAEFRVEVSADATPTTPSPDVGSPREPAPVMVIPAAPLGRIEADCPACGYHYDLEGKLAGKRARCKGCGAIFRVATPLSTIHAAPEPLLDALIDEDPDPVATIPEPERPTLTRPFPTADQSRGAPPSTPKLDNRRRTAMIAAAIVVGLPVFWLTFSLVRRAILGNEAVEIEVDDFDLFSDAPPAPLGPVRPALVASHRNSLGTIAETTERIADALGAMLDRASGERFLPKLRDLEAKRDAARAGDANLPALGPAEDRVLLAEFGPRLIAALERERNGLKQVDRSLGSPDQIHAKVTELDHAIATIHLGLGRSTIPPCVDVIIADLDPQSSDAIATRLKALADSQPPKLFVRKASKPGEKPGVAFRIGPVADPEAFARKIDFGKVQGRSNRKIRLTEVRGS